MAAVGKHIKQLRAARNMTQEELAQKLYVTRQTVSAWETGRSQPDLDALEQIAAALGAEVTEIIYGPQAGLGELKRQWVRRGISIGVLLTMLYYLVFCQGFWDTWTRGLAYQFGDPAYQITGEVLPGSWTVELDFTDPDSNRGKVLYEDRDCRITVADIAWNVDGDQAWNIWFTSEGTCRQGGGTIVSGMMTESDDLIQSRYSTDRTAAMTVTMDGVTHPGTPVGDTILFKNQKNFGYTLFHSGSEADRPETATVTVEGLMRFSTHRIR